MTHVYKDSCGNWCAETEIKLTDTLSLEILTMKRSSGAISTSATVHKLEGQWKSHAMFSDFRTTAITQLVRCTEKNVKLQHDEALKLKDTLLTQARNHYKLS